MAAIITEEDGVVAGIQGDAVMAFWGWPEDQPDQVERAVRAALRIQDRFGREGWWQDLSCGIGLAHGPAVAGRLGAHDLAKIDVFGPVVNLAARLEGYTKRFGVRVLTDAATADRVAASPLAEKLRWRTRKLARILPAGMSHPQLVYELVAGAGMTEARRVSWEQAVDGFLAGDWGSARATLEEWFADDPAAKVLLDWMAAHQDQPPADWTGTVQFEGK